jgi:hypothetical protein
MYPWKASMLPQGAQVPVYENLCCRVKDKVQHFYILHVKYIITD